MEEKPKSELLELIEKQQKEIETLQKELSLERAARIYAETLSQFHYEKRAVKICIKKDDSQQHP